VPLYDVACKECGVREVVRPISQHAQPFACPECGGPAEQRFSPAHALHVRIDDMENVGRDRNDPRTRGINLGLPGRFIEVDRRPDGTPIKEYRPTTSAEASSVRKAKEIARRNGLQMADAGRYRSTR
jgi:putative FmdB family regulatory protein